MITSKNLRIYNDDYIILSENDLLKRVKNDYLLESEIKDILYDQIQLFIKNFEAKFNTQLFEISANGRYFFMVEYMENVEDIDVITSYKTYINSQKHSILKKIKQIKFY